MSFRPAGYSSDEDEDEFNSFSFHGDVKSEKERREEIAAEVLNRRLEEENTANHRFYTAVIKGNLDQIREELKNGFDINSEISCDWTALFLSTVQRNHQVVEELLANGADIKITRDGSTLLMAVCDCPKKATTVDDTLTIIRLLLKYGVDVKAKDRKRRNALMFACAQGFIEVVKELFPLSDLEDQDNQGWTALFYAVNENEYEISKFLIENGANVDHIDVRNGDIKYYATLNDYESILKLLPKSDFDICPDDFAYNFCNYESVFETLKDGEIPDFKSDISSLLYGMKCQNFIPMFNKNNIDLLAFLILNDENLKELGISLTFQRNRILQGLYRFHRSEWKKKSIPFTPLHETFTTQHIFVCITNAIKHLVVLEATIKYLIQNLNLDETNIEKNLITVKTVMALRKINRIKRTVRLLHEKALHYDAQCEGSADLITNKRSFRKNTLNKNVAFGFFGITAIILFKYIKSHTS